MATANDGNELSRNSVASARGSQGQRAQAPAGRRRTILQLLRAGGAVSVAELEREFGVSAMTARRDLRELEKEGLALRTYGGAVLPATAAVDGSFEQRMTEFVEAKTHFGLATVELISDGDTVFVDASTAAYFALRELLAAGRSLTIVTNCLPVLELLADSEQLQVVSLGGTYRPTTRCFVGPETVRAGRSLHVDKALISIRGLTSDGELSDVDPLEAEVRRTMIEQCSESILFVTGATLARRGLSVVARLQDITHVLAVDVSDGEARRLAALTSNLTRL